MKLIWGKISALFIALVIMFAAGSNFCIIHADKDKVLRVGYMDYDGFITKQSDGTYSGYGAEYLAKISEYTDYHYEYVYGTGTELLDKLKKGEIDLLCNIQYTENRSKLYDYSEYPIGYTHGLLYGAADSSIAYEDYTAFNNMNVGIISESAMYEIFSQYEESNGFTCNIVRYSSEREMTDALSSGAIDAMCSEHLANHKGLTLLAQLGVDAFYIVSDKDSPYMSQINYALRQIKTDEDFESDLYHKNYDDSAAETTLQFTTAEKKFIDDCKTFVVGINGDRSPFSEYDKKTGLFHGICIDVLDEISKTSGLKFKYVVQDPGVKTVDMIDSGKYDIICGVERDNFITDEKVISTEAFLKSAIVPVGLSGRELNLKDDLTVAYPASFQALKKNLETNYPDLKLQGYKCSSDCLDAVMSGKADLFIQNTHLLSQILQKPRYDGVDILPVEVMTEHTAMALPRSSDPMLLSILNKSIENLDEATVSSSLIKYTFASPYEYTLSDFIYRFRIQIFVTALLVVMCFALLIMIMVIRQHSTRNLALVNSSLKKAIVKADSANVAKSQFLAQMSHEIRTPMNAIIGLTELAKNETDDPDKIKEYLTKIDGSSRLLLGIINDVLDMSAIEGGKLKIDSAAFNFRKMITNITAVFYQQSKIKNINFKVQMDGITEEVIVGDELRINQILMNLLSNAVKFTPAGGKIELTVIQASHSQDKVQMRFSVSDNGCGMGEDMIKRLFKPFEQESASTARKHGGSGLGLSITKNLTEMMGGSISVESKTGEGSRFTVDIPFGTDKDDHCTEVSDFSQIRTLIIDDDEKSCEYSGILLERLGVRYEYITTGKEAFEKLEEAEKNGDPFKLCIIDWKMPDMDGTQVTKKIRNLYGKNTIVIIISAYDISEVESTGKSAGADYFIPKPLFQSTLFNALMRISGGEYGKKEQVPEKDKYNFSGRHVLVAEDVGLNMEIITKILELVGVEVTGAEDGKQALEIFENSQNGTFDCILMDVNMPVMDGYEATGLIRKSCKADSQSIPIYAMTANAFSEDVTAALNSGMNGHIAKPIDTKVLYQTLNNIFDNKVQ